MQKIIPCYLLLALCVQACIKPQPPAQVPAAHEKTVFQTASVWKPEIDVRADVAIIYGAQDYYGADTVTFEARVQSWRNRGYITHFMTGIAWGAYQDYFTGTWDGQWHLDEGQVTQKGDTLWHGHRVPYLVPTNNFITYLQEKVIKRAIDAGIDAIYLEEPEFWARAGYSEAFKREWKAYYGTEWQPQHTSPENTYLANKLKYYLYSRALKACFTYAKAYGKTKGMHVRCYVPTHSLVNYAQWMIVSPEASLASLSCVDGYIAQVWTGTAREPNYFNGQAKERVFEAAFLEYGAMESMTAPTDRKMFFLTDPIEDRPRDWADYKRNYEATFTAQLLYPMMANYEVMPWPNRIYQGYYRTSPVSNHTEQIPRFYATQLQVMINSLNNMPPSDQPVSGAQGIGVLMGNSLMFQRYPTHEGYDDPQLANFYGQTLPLLKRGVPVKTVHIENVSFPRTWKDLKILIMSYTNMKPMDKIAHDHLARWVKNGGVLVYCGRDDDAFQHVPEWWNTGSDRYSAPAEHLFTKLGLQPPFAAGQYPCGKGTVCMLRNDPKEFVLTPHADTTYIHTLRNLYQTATAGDTLPTKNHFTLTRGPYEIIAVLDEHPDTAAYTIHGNFIDLFDPDIPILHTKQIHPGEQAYLYNLNHIKSPETPQVLATAARIDQEIVTAHTYTFVAKSPLHTTNVMRIHLPAQPTQIKVTDAAGKAFEVVNRWDEDSKTLYLCFENNPEGVGVRMAW